MAGFTADTTLGAIRELVGMFEEEVRESGGHYDTICLTRNKTDRIAEEISGYLYSLTAEFEEDDTWHTVADFFGDRSADIADAIAENVITLRSVERRSGVACITDEYVNSLEWGAEAKEWFDAGEDSDPEDDDDLKHMLVECIDQEIMHIFHQMCKGVETRHELTEKDFELARGERTGQ